MKQMWKSVAMDHILVKLTCITLPLWIALIISGKSLHLYLNILSNAYFTNKRMSIKCNKTCKVKLPFSLQFPRKMHTVDVSNDITICYKDNIRSNSGCVGLDKGRKTHIFSFSSLVKGEEIGIVNWPEMQDHF
jgi:hypothetical protein